MDVITLIGFLAALLTTTAFIPQVLKIVKTKNTKDISLGMYVIFTSGIACWLIYGILIMNIPMITANCITLLLASLVLFYKIKHG